MTREESIELYKKYSRKLFNTSFRIVGDEDLAEEIMQDSILKFIAGVEGGKAGMTEAQTGSWLTRTCVRASIDALRKIKRERLFLEEYSKTDTDITVGTGESDVPDEIALTVDKVKSAIKELPDSYRLILTLVLLEGLDYEEISEITNEKEGALRTRFSRARKVLVERLKGEEKTIGEGC